MNCFKIKKMIRKSEFISALFLFFLTTYTYAQHTDEEYTTLFAKTIQYVDQHQLAIWPGFRLSDYSFVMNIETMDSGTRAYAYQFKPENPSFWKELKIGNMLVYNRNNLFDYDTSGFQQLDNQKVFVYSFYNLDNYLFDPKTIINSITKTLFSDFQFFHSHFSASALNKEQYAYSGFNDITNIAWVEIEREILKNYLENKNNEELKNYLAAYHNRIKNLNDNSKQFENALELESGVKSYVMLKSMNLNIDDTIKEILSYYSDLYCKSLEDLYNAKYCLTERHYRFVDMVLGFALDKIGKENWKSVVETNSMNFSTLLLDYYPMTEAEMNQRIEKVKQQYQFENKMAVLNTKLKPYLDDMQNQINQSQALPGIPFSFDTRGCSSLYPDHKDNVYDVDSQTILMTNYKARYLCDGNNYRMNAFYDYTPYVYRKGDFETVKVTPETLLVIDDKQESILEFIKANKKINFHRLLIENNLFMLRINGLEGTLDGANQQIVMKINNQNLPHMKMELPKKLA